MDLYKISYSGSLINKDGTIPVDCVKTLNTKIKNFKKAFPNFVIKTAMLGGTTKKKRLVVFGDLAIYYNGFQTLHFDYWETTYKSKKFIRIRICANIFIEVINFQYYASSKVLQKIINAYKLISDIKDQNPKLLEELSHERFVMTIDAWRG